MHSPFTIEELYNQYEGKYQFNLSSATLPALSLNDLLELIPDSKQELLCQELLETKLDYSEQFGNEQLRQRLASKYSLTANNFLVTSAASEAINLVFNSLFNKDDCIIVQQPIYQSLYQIALDNGVRVINWDCCSDWDTNYHNLQELTKANPHYKALVINNPNNPLGIGFDKNKLTQITNILEDKLLIADEVFIDISQNQLCSAIELYDNAIIISDLSKSYSLPGLRLGWIASKDIKLLNIFSNYKNYLSLRSSTLSELISTWVLEHATTILSRNKKIIKDNINYLLDTGLKINIKPNAIEGLCIFPKSNLDLDLIFHKLITQEQCFLVTGSCFGDKYKQHYRLGLGNKNFKEALDKFISIS